MLSLFMFSTIFSDNLVVLVKVKEFLKLATHQTFVQLGPRFIMKILINYKVNYFLGNYIGSTNDKNKFVKKRVQWI